MNKPVICLKDEGISDLVLKYDCGIVAEGFGGKQSIESHTINNEKKINYYNFKSLMRFSHESVLKTYLDEV